MEKYLLILSNSKETIIIFKTKNSRTVAHKIRQAFLSAELAEHEQYKDLRNQWRIKEELDSIICIRKSTEEPTLVEVIKEVGTPFPTVTRLEEVVGVCIENKYRPIIFPNFQPDSKQLDLLKKWGESANVEFHYTGNKLTARPTIKIKED